MSCQSLFILGPACNEHPVTTNTFFCVPLLVVSETECKPQFLIGSLIIQWEFDFKQVWSMHYSRMRTARLLPYLPACTAPGGLLPGGGGVCCQGGVCSGDWVSGQTPTPVYRILDTRFWKYYLAPTLRAVTRMHSSRMRTGRSLPYLGGSPWTENPPSRQEVTSYRDPPPLWTDRRLWKYYLAPNFVCGR